MEFFNINSMLAMAGNFINDKSMGSVFRELTAGIHPDKDCKLSLVVTERNIQGNVRYFLSVCSVNMMNITTIHKQYSVEDLRALLKDAKKLL